MKVTDQWTDKDWRDWLTGSNDAAQASLRRACNELDAVAKAIDELSPRLRRKLMRGPLYTLDPDLIRNEAERGRDTLAVYGAP